MEDKQTVLYLNSYRDGYAIDQVQSTMTVGELQNFLEDFDEDMPIYLRHDNGYTFGGIVSRRFVFSNEVNDNDWY